MTSTFDLLESDSIHVPEICFVVMIMGIRFLNSFQNESPYFKKLQVIFCVPLLSILCVILTCSVCPSSFKPNPRPFFHPIRSSIFCPNLFSSEKIMKIITSLLYFKLTSISSVGRKVLIIMGYETSYVALAITALQLRL